MKKPSGFEIAYEALSRIASGPMSEEAVSELRRALSGRTSLLVSRAADVAARRGLSQLIPDMISAFERFMIDGAHIDKQCNAKISIVNALNKLEYMGEEVFLAGARYVQMEPRYGEPEDSGVQVRCGCAFGLARTEHPDAVYILTDLLADAEAGVRSAAAKSLTYFALPESEVLLRLKALIGDTELAVIGECFEGLMAMSPDRSLDFVARHVRSEDDALAQYAALAIGGSRLPRAYDTLRECWDDNPSPTARRMLLLPIALARSDQAFSFLLEVVRAADLKTAAEAVAALRIYTSPESIGKIGEAVNARKDTELLKVFEKEIGRG